MILRAAVVILNEIDAPSFGLHSGSAAMESKPGSPACAGFAYAGVVKNPSAVFGRCRMSAGGLLCAFSWSKTIRESQIS